MITAAQVRAARALLNWTQDELAQRSNVAARSIRNLENEDRRSYAQTIDSLRAAFESAGIVFLEVVGGRGVLLMDGPFAVQETGTS